MVVRVGHLLDNHVGRDRTGDCNTDFTELQPAGTLRKVLLLCTVTSGESAARNSGALAK